jgi:hypothetical protein
MHELVRAHARDAAGTAALIKVSGTESELPCDIKGAVSTPRICQVAYCCMRKDANLVASFKPLTRSLRAPMGASSTLQSLRSALTTQSLCKGENENGVAMDAAL